MTRASTSIIKTIILTGTAYNYGEDQQCRGRVLIFILDGKTRDPTYIKRTKGPVMALKGNIFGNFLAYSWGHRLHLCNWQNSALSLATFHDTGMCITSINVVKNYMAVGDIHRGVEFLRWIEDPHTRVKKLDRLSRNAPSASGTTTVSTLLQLQITTV